MRCRSLAAVLGLVLLSACGGGARAAAVRAAPPAPAAPAAAGLPASAAPTPAPRYPPLVDIPVDLQDRRATCEVAALKMALAGRGIVTDERSLLALTGIDDRPAVDDGHGGIAHWGDPNASFVGDPDGSPPDHTGYGVYAAPIARAAERSGATVTASGTGISPASLYEAVRAGQPAVAWVTNDYKRDATRTWVAWDGELIHYTLTEHAVLVVAVTPTQVLVNDPYFGRHWHSRTEFEAAYDTFDEMAVVLR